MSDSIVTLSPSTNQIGFREDCPSLEESSEYSDVDSCSISTEVPEYSTTFATSKFAVPVGTVPRSIFNDYWQSKGGASCIRRSSVHSTISSFFTLDSTFSYEKTLHRTENGFHKTPHSEIGRRRIFNKNCISESEPSLSLLTCHQMRKVKSSSYLQRVVKRSCLRKSKYSGGSLERQESCGSSVSFNDEVKVVVFEKPREFYSQEGWSDYFA